MAYLVYIHAVDKGERIGTFAKRNVLWIVGALAVAALFYAPLVLKYQLHTPNPCQQFVGRRAEESVWAALVSPLTFLFGGWFSIPLILRGDFLLVQRFSHCFEGLVLLGYMVLLAGLRRLLMGRSAKKGRLACVLVLFLSVAR